MTMFHKRKTGTKNRSRQVRAQLGFLLDHQDPSKSHPVNIAFAIMTFSGNYIFASLLKYFIQQWFCSSMKHSWLDFQHCYTWGLLYRTVFTQRMWKLPFSSFQCTFSRKIRKRKILFYKKSNFTVPENSLKTRLFFPTCVHLSKHV